MYPTVFTLISSYDCPYMTWTDCFRIHKLRIQLQSCITFDDMLQKKQMFYGGASNPRAFIIPSTLQIHPGRSSVHVYFLAPLLLLI